MRRALLLGISTLSACGSVYHAAEDIDAGSGSATGPIADYEMDAVGSGTACSPDAIGHHDGTCDLAPTLAPGHRGSGYHFDGTQAFFVAPTGDLETMSAMTVMVWMKLDDDLVASCPINRTVGATEGNRWQICLQRGPDALIVYADGGPPLTREVPTWDTQWHHLALSWDGTSEVVLLDGQPIATETAHYAFSAEDRIAIGEDLDPGGSGGLVGTAAVVGTLDELRLYARALSVAEVQALATE